MKKYLFVFVVFTLGIISCNSPKSEAKKLFKGYEKCLSQFSSSPNEILNADYAKLDEVTKCLQNITEQVQSDTKDWDGSKINEMSSEFTKLAKQSVYKDVYLKQGLIKEGE
jgi:hypothetical protein